MQVGRLQHGQRGCGARIGGAIVITAAAGGKADRQGQRAKAGHAA